MARLIPRKQIEEQQNISGSLSIQQNVEIGPTKNIIQLVNELPDVQQNNSSKFNSTNYIF